MRKQIIFLISFLYLLQSYSQNLEYARKTIDTLCSGYFSGRGYINDGMSKAAFFIEKEYESLGTLRFGDSFLQEFSFNIQRILSSSVAKGKKQAGYDYVVHVLSACIKGRHKVFVCTHEHLKQPKLSEFINTNHTNHIIVFPPSVYERKEYTEIVHTIVYSGLKKAKGFIMGTSVQPSWDVAYLYSQPYDAVIIKMKAEEQYFLDLNKISIEVETDKVIDFRAYNVAGYIPGTIYPDSFIVFCAHYDHLGMMGNVMYPGANDNASGVAMMLDLMNHYSKEKNRAAYSIAFLAFACEEAGILGSEFFINNPLLDIEAIKFLINLDLVGTGKEGIQIVNGSIYQPQFDAIVRINNALNYLPEVKIRGESCNSDHCPFYKAGVPSFFIYTLDSEYPWYHVPQDKADKLPLTGYEGLFRLLVDFCKEI